MKSLFSNLKKGNQIYIFVLLGIIFLLFPGKIAEFAPYIAGGTLIVYSVVNIIMEIRFPESRISLGDAVVRGVLGIILLLETEQAIAILGIVWAVLSLNDVAKEINDYVLSEFNMPCHKIEEYRMFLEKRENLRKMAENDERYSIYIV